MGFEQSRYQAPSLTKFGIQTVKEIIFGKPDDYLKQGAQLKAGFPHVNPGDVLGRITASGLFRRVPRVLLRASTLGNATSFVATDELGAIIEPPFLVGDSIDVDTAGNLDNVVISAINNATGVITVAAMTHAHNAGVIAVLHTLDGSETAVGIAQHPAQAAIFNPVDTPNSNFLLDVDYGIDIILVGAVVRSQLRGVDATVKTDLNLKGMNPAFDAYQMR